MGLTSVSTKKDHIRQPRNHVESRDLIQLKKISTTFSAKQNRKHQSSTSLASNSKRFPCDDISMLGYTAVVLPAINSPYYHSLLQRSKLQLASSVDAMAVIDGQAASDLWGKFHEWFMSSQLQSLSRFYFNDSIRSQFCTCHDSWAVMTCAKLWPC